MPIEDHDFPNATPLLAPASKITPPQPESFAGASRGVLRRLALGAVVDGLLHEIVNPMNVVLMNAELGLLCLNEKTDREAAAGAFATIVNETHRLSEIVAQIRAFAQADDFTPNGSSKLTGIVDQAVKLLGPTPARAGAKLSIASDPAGCRAAVNHMAIAIVLAGLVRHAIELGAREIVIAVIDAGESVEVALSFDIDVRPSGDVNAGFDLRFAEQVLADHHGAVTSAGDSTASRLVLMLPK